MKNYYLSFFFKLDTWPGMWVTYLMGTGLFHSVLEIAHEQREPPRITQIKQRVGGRKWPCLGQLVSGFFRGGGGHKRIKIYVKCSLIWMTIFLRFWKKKLRYQWLFPFVFATSHINVDWFNTMCLSLSERWSYIR